MLAAETGWSGGEVHGRMSLVASSAPQAALVLNLPLAQGRPAPLELTLSARDILVALGISCRGCRLYFQVSSVLMILFYLW